MDVHRYIGALRQLGLAYERVRVGAPVELAPLGPALDALAPQPAPAVDLGTIVTALDYLPGELWHMSDLLLMAGALPSGPGERWEHPAQGLAAMETTADTMMLSLGNDQLGLPVLYWCAMLQLQAERLFARAAEMGLDDRIDHLFGGGNDEDDEELPEGAAEQLSAMFGIDFGGDDDDDEYEDDEIAAVDDDDQVAADAGDEVAAAAGDQVAADAADDDADDADVDATDATDAADAADAADGAAGADGAHGADGAAGVVYDAAGDAHDAAAGYVVDAADADADAMLDDPDADYHMQVERLLAEVAFAAGGDYDQLVELDTPRQGRLAACLMSFAWRGWRPRVMAHQDLHADQRAAHDFALQVGTAIAEQMPGERPLHLVLCDTPAITDVLSPYARELREVMTRWAATNPDAVRGGKAVQQALAQGQVSENLLYWIMRDFQLQRPELFEERVRADATCGILHRGAMPATPGSFQLIDLERLDLELVDPRLLVAPGGKRRSGAVRPSGVLVVLPLQEQAHAHTALELLLERLGNRVASVNVLRRALPLADGPQLLLPTAWIDQTSGACVYAPPTADLQPDDFWGLIDGDVTSVGAMVSVASSMGQHPELLDQLATRWQGVGLDLKGAELVSTVLRAGLAHGGMPSSWSWRAVYYASGRLLEADRARQGLAESALLSPAYAAAVAVLRAILSGRSARPEPAPPPSTPPRGGPRMRLRA